MKRAKARQLIRELFSAGFSPQEIEELTEARWKSNTISKYCKDLEVIDTSEKNRAIGLWKEFIQNDGSWEELEYYVKTKKKLESENLVLDDLIEQKKEIDNHGVDLSTVGSINAVLRERNSNWNEFLNYVEFVVDVNKLGYTLDELEILKQKTLEFGGLEPTLRIIFFVLTKADVQKKKNEFNKEIEKLIDEAKTMEREIEQMEHQIIIKQTYVDYAEELLNKYKFDPIALQTIVTLAQNYGTPIIVLQALNTFGNLRKLEENIQAKIEAIKSHEQDITKLKALKENYESQIADLYRRIGAIQEKQKQSIVLHKIANLINDPANAEIDPNEFKILSLSLLMGMRDYSTSHSSTLPKWNIFVKNYIENAADKLNNIILGKL